MTPTFFWHDYETFGRLPRRDRPSQFAGIRTDADLNEISAPLTLYCQPTDDVLPDPEACLLTGITPQHSLAHGVPEPAFAEAIHTALAEPGTIGVGYNSLRFDDEVTRHLLWRNLMEPYGREYLNGNARWDLLDTVRAMHALRPDGLHWPQKEDGSPSFKLEHLTAANGLAHEAAHDAVSDVRATIALARAVRAAQPRLWDFCLRLRDKHAVWAEIGQGRPFLHVSGMYGTARGNLALVWPLAMHPVNKNELIVWDLAHDPAELESLNAAQIRERLYTRSEDLPEGVTRLPIKTIHANKSPVVIASLRTLAPAQAERWGLDMAAQLARVPEAQRITPLMLGIWPDVYARPAPTQPVDVDEALYDGFIGRTDRQRLDRQRQEPGRAMSFDDARLDELAFRWRARHHAATLTEPERARWQQHRIARLHHGAGGALTLAGFAEQIDTLYETADARGQAILEQLADYAEQIAPPA